MSQSWDQDRQRCRQAGIPDEVVYRPKTEIALELYDRVVKHGVRFGWLTFDEWYGSKPSFLWALAARGQNFVGEILRSFRAWLKPPRVTSRPFRRRQGGRGRRIPRLLAGSLSAQTVEHLTQTYPGLAAQAWQTWRVKDSDKGPLLWHVKQAGSAFPTRTGCPRGRIICWSASIRSAARSNTS